MCKVFCEIFWNIFVIFVKYFHNFPRASFVRFSHLFFAFIVHIICFRFCWNCRIGLQCFIYKFLPQFEGFYRYPHCLIVMRPTHRSHRNIVGKVGRVGEKYNEKFSCYVSAWQLQKPWMDFFEIWKCLKYFYLDFFSIYLDVYEAYQVFYYKLRLYIRYP